MKFWKNTHWAPLATAVGEGFESQLQKALFKLCSSYIVNRNFFRNCDHIHQIIF